MEPKKILALDDTLSNLDILDKYLDKFDLFTTTSSEDMFKLLKEVKIDLILLDIVMPGINGIEICKELKKLPETKNTPIIFITSKSDEESIEKAYEAGGVDYVTKPFRQKELLSRINTHLTLSEQNRALEERIEKEIQKRLEQQKILVEQARSAAMGNMMGFITHQWKQPLNNIAISNGNIELNLILNEFSQEELLNETKQISNTINFMNETISDFKNYFSTNKIKSRFGVKEQVLNIYNIIKLQLINNNIDLYLDIEDDIKGYGVASEFKHLLLNLISNAKDAIIENDTKTRNITIKATKLDDKTTTLTVQDSGGGIPENIINKIFNDQFTTKGENGTGIGLSMTKLIVEDEMKGKISVCNNEDGALFRVDFPSANT